MPGAQEPCHTGAMTGLGAQSRRIPPAVRRLDGRVKIALLVAYSAMLFLIGSPIGLGVAVAFLSIVMAVGRVRFASVLRAGAPAWVIAAFLLFYNAAASGWAAGVVVAARVMLLVYASGALMELSTTTELSEALRRLLAPLGRVGLPVRDATCALSIALRFIPVTAEELASIRAAQASRGASLGSGGVAARAGECGPYGPAVRGSVPAGRPPGRGHGRAVLRGKRPAHQLRRTAFLPRRRRSPRRRLWALPGRSPSVLTSCAPAPAR